MTIAEVILLVFGGIGLYFVLRPLQRWIEHRLLRTFFFRRASSRRPIIDVTDLASHPLFKKDNHEHRS